MALLDELFSALQAGQTPWAQEALRRLRDGQELAGIDQDVARRARQPALRPLPPEPPSEPRPIPPEPPAEPRSNGDAFRGPARLATVADINSKPPMAMGPQDFAARAENLPSGGETPRAAAVVAEARPAGPGASVAPSAPRSTTAREPDFSAGVAPFAKFLGLDKLGIDGGERARMQRLAYDALVAKGTDPKMAELYARQPELLAQIIPKMIDGEKTQVINNKLVDKRTGKVIADYGDSARQGPDVKEIDGPYGQKIKVQWDAKAGQYVPLRIAGEPAPQPAAQPAPAPAAAIAPAAPVVPPEAPKAGPQPAPEPAAQPATPRTQGEFRVGPAVQKPPDGYVHRLSQDGTGYLYTAQGQPVFEAREGIDARAKSIDKDREKAVGAVDTIRRMIELRGLLDKPLGFDKPYSTRAGATFNTFGDVVGPWAVPETLPTGQGSGPAAVVKGMLNVPSYMLDTVRKIKGQYVPEVATINRARNEVETALSNLQAARVKELFGASQLSDADREAAYKTVGSMTAQDAAALKKQMEVGERDSFNNIKRGLDAGLIRVEDVPPEILSRGVQLGIFRGRGK